MNCSKLMIACFFCLILSIAKPVYAANTVFTNVQVIHASTNSTHVDPQLKSISAELESVFKYTSYRLIQQKNMSLKFGDQGRVDLPGERTLMVQPIGMEGKRIRCQINIRKNNKKIFQTKILLKNNDSITIGGPRYHDGVLIFNILGRLQ